MWSHQPAVQSDCVNNQFRYTPESSRGSIQRDSLIHSFIHSLNKHLSELLYVAALGWLREIPRGKDTTAPLQKLTVQWEHMDLQINKYTTHQKLLQRWLVENGSHGDMYKTAILWSNNCSNGDMNMRTESLVKCGWFRICAGQTICSTTLGLYI